MTSSLRVDLSGCWLDDYGLTRQQFLELSSRLDEARHETVVTDETLMQSGEIPDEKQPLDGRFYLLPEGLLKDYGESRATSELQAILSTARHLQATSDAVVVLGIGGSYMGTRAIMDSCCEPFFNELDEGRRGGRPRVYFEGNSLDNDSVQALLARLQHQRWSIVVVS